MKHSKKARRLKKKIGNFEFYKSKSASRPTSPSKLGWNQPVILKLCLRSRSHSDHDVSKVGVRKRVTFLIPRKTSMSKEFPKTRKASKEKTIGMKAVHHQIKKACAEIKRPEKKPAKPLNSFSSDLLLALNEDCTVIARLENFQN